MQSSRRPYRPTASRAISDHHGARDGPLRISRGLALISIARKYFQGRWALLATLGIWWASSIPVYMYFNPSWSHAHSAFAAAVSYGIGTAHAARARRQWIVLGLISGLIVDIYYPNGILLFVPLLEALGGYWMSWAGADPRILRAAARAIRAHVLFTCVFLVALLPTFISRRIIFGSPFELATRRELQVAVPGVLASTVVRGSRHFHLDSDSAACGDRPGVFPARDKAMAAY